MIGRVLSETKTDCLETALDRGKGEPRGIENWMLLEMNAELLSMKEQSFLQEVEGEHSYGARRGRADLWWKNDGEEHWIEVKAMVVNHEGIPRPGLGSLTGDLRKIMQNKDKGIMHELVIIYPMMSHGHVERWTKIIQKKIPVDFTLEPINTKGFDKWVLVLFFTLKC